METALEIEPFSDDSDQYINADRNPDLGSDRVLRGAVEGLDTQMLFDPSKEQLHLPAALVELSNGESRQEKVVGKKYQPLLIGSIVVTHSANSLGISTFGNGIVERDDLVGLQTGPLVDPLREKPPTIEAFLGPGHEERSRLVQSVESSKIEISTIHQVNGARFPKKLVEDVDFVNLSTGHNHYGGNRAAKIEQGVKFHGRFAPAELSPRKQGQAQIDGGGIQGVDGLIEFEAEGFVAVKIPCYSDQHLSEVGVDSPIAHPIGMGQGVA